MSTATICIVGIVMMSLGIGMLLDLITTKLNRLEATATKAQAAALRQEQALAQVVEQTRATAEACAALTQWAERGSK